MKFSSAAVLFLAAASSTQAFVPGRSSISTFGVAKRKSTTTAVRSTTEDDIAAKHKKKNNSYVSNVPRTELQQHRHTLHPNAKQRHDDQDDQEMARIAAIETRAAAAAYLSQYEGQSGASIVYSKLEENGVEVVNGFSGGAVLPLLDQFHASHPRHAGKPPIRWITNSNESSAGHIAEGYGKSQPVNGKHKPVGVVVATSGPGLTNLITPLQDAMCDGVPVLAMCGQAATTAPPDAFQSAPAVELTKPCTKWSYQIKSAAEVPMVMDYAFYIARNGRPGPVFIDLPKDLQNQILTPELVQSFVHDNLSGEDDNINNDNSPANLAKLSQRRRPDGSIYQAVSVGSSHEQRLPFEIAKEKNAIDHPYRMTPVAQVQETAETRDNHHADHIPTFQITHQDPSSGKLLTGPLHVDSELTLKVLHLIRQARKPIILAGQGCNDAAEELQEFAEALQIPVTTTLHGLGAFDERNPLALNMVGMHGHATPNFMCQEADLIVSIGSRFDDRITGRMGDYVPAARQAAEEGRGGLIHVDIRRTEHGKQLSPTFFVHSTGKHFLQTMNEGLQKLHHYGSTRPGPGTAAWLARKRELQQQFPVTIPTFSTQHVKLHDDGGQEMVLPRTAMSMQQVITEMDKQLLEANQMDNCIFSTGVGVHQMIAAQLITWTQPRQMLSSGSLGTMGVALGYAIGGKLANKNKCVISVDGDGSFNMTFTELKTLAEQGIPIKMMILDNDGQMMVEYWQRLFHDGRLLAVRNNANPDYVQLAKAFGIKAVYCDAAEDLPEVMKEFLFDYPDEPVLFHCRVQRTPCLPMVAPGQPLDDMILEDVEVDTDGLAAPS